MRYAYVPESEAAHEADAARCSVCHSAYGKHHPRPPKPTPWQKPPHPPLVAARPPQGPDEMAGGNGQAVSTGKLARRHGWQVWPTYFMAFDGSECCLLSMSHGPLRAIASWQRKPGDSWAAETGYGWSVDLPGSMTRLSVTRLRAVIKTVGEQ